MTDALKPLGWGEPGRWFHAAALSGSPRYCFDSVAGRHIVLLFLGSAKPAAAAAALRLVDENRELFDDFSACFFGVTSDPEDASSGRIAQHLPGIRFFLDYDRKVASAYGAAADGRYLPHWLILDPTLRALAAFPLENGDAALAFLRTALSRPAEPGWVPVLKVPNVLEPDLCRMLIDHYETEGGKESGFMREIDGKTVPLIDPKMKQRQDCQIPEGPMRKALMARIEARLLPMIHRAFQFRATRIERYIVACYDSSGGYFRPHRDNTTKGTAHRRFAVSINLNAEEHEGGDLRFPEFGDRTYRPPTGGAVVFSCSLLHEATPVTAGRRYAFLPFLYDEDGARLREANAHSLPDAEPYKA